MQWDPAVYDRFRRERERPFHDLLAALPARRPRTVIDAGCGTGRTTRALAERWPEATVVGVDSSASMLAEACGPLSFIQADITAWRPAERADLVVANAVLQWIPGPQRMLAHLVSWLSKDGVVAFQVPANQAAPSHRIVRALAEEPRWKGRLAGAAWGDHVLTLEGYRDALSRLGFRGQAWENTYRHVLAGADAVAQWLEGTTLRPVFDVLDDAEKDAFLAELQPRLRDAYPEVRGEVVFPFKRRFVVAMVG